jgi:hypothetical protein
VGEQGGLSKDGTAMEQVSRQGKSYTKLSGEGMSQEGKRAHCLRRGSEGDGGTEPSGRRRWSGWGLRFHREAWGRMGSCGTSSEGMKGNVIWGSRGGQ